jgi:hypothetical protein
MSDASANALLSQTAKSYLNGKILDVDTALSPFGGLYIKQNPIGGFIVGLRANSEQLKVFAVDKLGRDFAVNVSQTQIDTNNLWSRNTLPDQITTGSQTEYLVGGSNFHYSGMRFGGNDGNWSIGTPLITVTDNIAVSAQITTLTFNPWIQFGGMWGSINYTSMFESVVTYKKEHWQAQFGWITARSSITPGLINRVDAINAVWAEGGYIDTNFGIYGGIRPYIVSGGVEAELPTGVDKQGNLQYTKTHFDINNPVNFYTRAVYTDKLTRNISYKLSGMAVDNGQFRTQLELRYFY